jgi:hypothetical protein
MSPSSPTAAYTRLPTVGDEREEESGAPSSDDKASVALTWSDKWRLAQPLIGMYMIPLCEFPILSKVLCRGAKRPFSLCLFSESASCLSELLIELVVLMANLV